MSGEKKSNPVSPASAVGVKTEKSEQRTSPGSIQVVRDPSTDRQPGPTAAEAEHRPGSSASTSQIPNVPGNSASNRLVVGGGSVSDESKGARSKSSTAIKIKKIISPKKNTEKGPTDTKDGLKTVDTCTCKGNRSGMHDGNCPINCPRLSPKDKSLKVPQSKKEKSPQKTLKERVVEVLSPKSKKLSGLFSKKKNPGKEMDTAEAMFQNKDSSDGKPGKKTTKMTHDSASWQGLYPISPSYLENPDESHVGSVSTTTSFLSEPDNTAPPESSPEHESLPRSPESDTEMLSDEY